MTMKINERETYLGKIGKIQVQNNKKEEEVTRFNNF
jgi:hypothetical protein